MQPRGTRTRRFGSNSQASPQVAKVPVKEVEKTGGTTAGAVSTSRSLRHSVRGAGSAAYGMLPGSVSTFDP